MKLTTYAFCLATLVATAVGCKNSDPELVPEPTSFTAQTVASGLTLPLGMSFDDQGRV